MQQTQKPPPIKAHWFLITVIKQWKKQSLRIPYNKPTDHGGTAAGICYVLH